MSVGTSQQTTFFNSNIVPAAGLCLLTVVVALLLKVFTVVQRKLSVQWALEKDFPVPPGAHWLLGHLVLLAKGELEFDRIGQEWAIQYPHSYIFKHGPLDGTLSVNHPDYIKAVLQRPDKKDERIYGLLRPWLGDGLLTTSGAKWFRNRRLLTPGFHFEVLRPYVKLFSDSTNVMLDNWKELGSGSSVDVFQHVSLMTLDSMLKCALSQDTGCQKKNTFNNYISVVHELSALVMVRARSLISSMSDFVYNNSSAGKRYKKACSDVHQFSEKIIQQRKQALDGLPANETSPRQKYLDFLDILLMAKDEDGNGLTDAEIRDEVDTFMFEGHDTTASGLAWTLYCLARHPGHQKKCRREAQEVLQGRPEVTWKDLPSLKYITMCIKESLRIYPPVPKILRELEAPLTLPDGKTVQKGTTIFICPQRLHLNPAHWEKPEEYDPLRFSPENSKDRHPYAFLPFSAGPRNCIGQHFAMNELKTSVALILQQFSLAPDDTLPEPVPVHKIVLRADSPGLFLKINPLS
ncbi:cytochrome P450 4A4-like [Branchiostoma lanceolatum]|uniref:cytochrome P450 4A4-like n=1 Tax=Branchiostoma lanceolatum TaxID=7740 RepID=UPI0034516451